MAKLNTRQITGSRAQRAGKEAEKAVSACLSGAGWGIVTSAVLDYSRKTDVLAECPEGMVYPLQVSISPKSARQIETLKERGVLNVTPKNVGQIVCGNCVNVESCQRSLLD